ncbi:MAG: NfeD family protein [Deltaproteobacteria bacterium]|nr:NfeD family protein [Deltaproteobacteria bacterium]
MPWWYWMLFGAALLVVEIMLPGSFFVIFFGVGAVVVGLLAGVGAVGEPWLEWLLFSAFSVGSLVAFRGRLLRHFTRSHASTVGTETYVGDTATLTEDLEAGGVGRAELRGTVWTVRSHETTRLVRGQRCRVERLDGLTLWVRPQP